VISVDNPQQILLPGMTAYVSIVFAQHDNVMLVPNAALRYKPRLDNNGDSSKTAANGNGTSQTPGKGDRRKAVEAAEAGGFGRGKVFVLQDGKPQLREVKVGITDGKLTEIVSDTLKSGDQVITGNAQADGQASGGAMRAPRMF
jgi:HlyD family secretion protein